MGQKVHPLGFRLGYIKTWQAQWFAGKQYPRLLAEDLQIRRHIQKKFADAGISRVEIERGANQVTVTIYTAKPGIVIGRGGQKVEELRHELEGFRDKRVRLNIQEIRLPEMEAVLVARSLADQIARRVSYRRAMKQTVLRTMQRGAAGIKITCSGRLGGAEMSRKATEREGRVPLHTLRADIDYGLAEAHTVFGQVGVKVWIYKGDVQMGRPATETEAIPLREAVLPGS